MDQIYAVVLAAHNVVRWIVVVLAILALVRAYLGWLGRRPWTDQDRKIGVFFGSAIDVQFLLGLILYFVLSPITRSAFQDFSGAMGNDVARFFLVEHVFYMIVAVALVHVGTVSARRASDDTGKHRRAAIWFSLAVLLILLGMPWFRPILPGIG
jgi:uncharacterized membrane protein YozB (DUF420 family)